MVYGRGGKSSGYLGLVLLTEEERPKQIPSFRRIRKASQVDNESVKTTTTRSDAKAGDSNSSISEQAQNADANSLANALEKMGLSSTDKPCSSGISISTFFERLEQRHSSRLVSSD